MRTVVSGIGIVSSLGIGADENIRAMRENRSGISSCPEILHTSNRLPVGEIKLSNARLAELAGLDASETVSRTALIGLLAAREALKDAKLRKGLRVGLVSATSVGGMDLTETFFPKYMQDSGSGRLRNVRMHDCGASTDFIAKHCGIEGYRTTISTACSSAANAIIFGDKLLKHNILDCVIVGGTDALSAFTLNGFNSLRILDSQPCRPFDESRAGLNLGEGAGYIVLQKEETLSKSPYCALSGYANANDANHQTASSENGDGACLAMKQAIALAGLSSYDIDYINVHGTGTGNNDLTEGRAMKRIFGEKLPPFSSTKGATGHTLAAAGGIEAVFSVLSLKYGALFPNLNFSEPISELGISPQARYIQGLEIHSVLSNSFGFGGNCTSLVFSKQLKER